MQKLNWNFVQVFGDKNPVEEIQDADIVSAVRFDQTGDFLATGDRGGRVVLFERANRAGKKSVRDKKTEPRPVEYKFYAEFQSHQPEFDYLKSLEIEEKIARIRWLPKTNSSHFLLTSNARTIKLWKVGEKQLKTMVGSNREAMKTEKRNGLLVPKLAPSQSLVAANPRRIFSNAHAYHINSISPSSDGETFLSADDLRVNLWHYDVTDESFNILDLKPPNMEELTEVITAAEFHPTKCNIFAYASSKGDVKLCDMRVNALCDKPARVFNEADSSVSSSFFGEIISSLSDVAFSPDGKYILGRDYMALKIWDVAMEGKPLRTIQIHEQLQSKLCDLYENEYIFDKFECTFSGDGQWAMTGSYHNMFQVYDIGTGGLDSCVEVTRNPLRRKVPPKSKPVFARLGRKDVKRGALDDIPLDQVDFEKKILHASWHPEEPTIAVAAANHLFIYNASST